MNGWPILISMLALLVSTLTAWLTFFRKGNLRMTTPTTIFFGPDGGHDGTIKVYLRTLLYSTSKRGQVVESLYISLRRGESKQNFSVWTCGSDRLERGSGLYVGLEGVVYNHHFLLPPDGVAFQFLAGDYQLEVFAKRVHDRAARRLKKIPLRVSDAQATEMRKNEAGLYFDWGPDQQTYLPHFVPQGSGISDTLSLPTKHVIAQIDEVRDELKTKAAEVEGAFATLLAKVQTEIEQKSNDNLQIMRNDFDAHTGTLAAVITLTLMTPRIQSGDCIGALNCSADAAKSFLNAGQFGAVGILFATNPMVDLLRLISRDQLAAASELEPKLNVIIDRLANHPSGAYAAEAQRLAQALKAAKSR